MAEPLNPRETEPHVVKNIYNALRLGTLCMVDREPKAPFRPRMEVYDDPGLPDVIVTFELPGVQASDVLVSVKDGVLSLCGERHSRYRPRRQPSLRRVSKAVHEGSSDGAGVSPASARAYSGMFPIYEMRYGKFRRSIQLPRGVIPARVSASISDGLLRVSWPRPIETAT
ncbi:hypothetical protein DFH06DRAFT_1135015 [Mycena polygramma]|nr:hypothetical protein DFH06DRAFT_1135015 [Mycena polygramma]